jgi:hypothetical protein
MKYENEISVNLKSEKNIHVVSGLLKNFLNSLPEPLFGYDLFEEIMKISIIEDNDKKIDETKTLFKDKLPTVNFNILKKLILFFSKIVENEKITKMNYSNIITILGPYLLKTRKKFDGEISKKPFIQFLIENHSQIFN